MKPTAFFLMFSILIASWSGLHGQEAMDWKHVAEAIPLGSRVKVERLGGSRIAGTLMRAGDDAVLVKKSTRLSEPAVSIPYAEIEKIETEHGGGMNVAKAIGIGVASGAGIFLGLLAIAVASWD